MLLPITQFGGIQPKIKDPRGLPENKGQVATNCRFDHGGVDALLKDLLISTPPNLGTLVSLFRYIFKGVFFVWNTDVKAITAPLANDSWHRVYYCESGRLKATDYIRYNLGGDDFPHSWLYPSPPAPASAPVAAAPNLPDFVPVATLFLTSTGLYVYEPTGTYAGIATTNKNTKIEFTGTGIPVLDDKELSFGTAYGPGHGFSSEVFVIPSIGSLMSGPISAITKANPGVCTTLLPHKLFTGDTIKITATGMTELNAYVGGSGPAITVTKIDDLNFSINVNTTSFTTFTGGTWDLVGRVATNIYPLVSLSAAGGDTISKTNPCSIHHVGHGLSTGQVLTFSSMSDMTQLNGVSAKIIVNDVDNFSLVGIDSSAFGTFVSGDYRKVPVFHAVVDPTLQETVFYVSTYINGYGSEGPPSPASNLVDIYDGDTVTLTENNTVAPVNYNIMSKNIYRSNKDASGNEVLQFLVNLPLATTAYADSILAKDLGEILPSAEWDAPPDGVEGLTALANETLAAFVESQSLVLFSEPGFPHAWPASYQKATDTPPMGIGVSGSSTLVLTQGVPYIVTGNHPSNYVMDKMGAGFSCASKRSVVQVGDMVVYSNVDGLAVMSTSSINILTKDIFTPEEWRSAYPPDSISGYLWEQKYVGFSSTKQSGFYFDFKTGDFVTLDFYATAGYHDETTGFLYLVINGSIYQFCGGPGYREMSHTGKRYRFLKSSIRAVKVLAPGYPVSVNVVYYNKLDNGFPTITIEEITADSEEPVRHTNIGMQEECEVNIRGPATAVYLASTLEEFKV